MKEIHCRNYCWTLNNPTKDEENLILLTEKNEDCKYTIFGREIGKEGTPHFQGYSEFTKPLRLKKFKEIMGSDRFHVEPRKGTRNQARNYCMKDNNFVELGKWSEKSQGKRSDLDEVCEEINNGASLRQLRLSNPGMIVKYNKGLKELIRLKEEDDAIKDIKIEMSDIKLYKWQEEIIDKLRRKPDKDKIMWYYGKPGLGKSTLKKFILINMEKSIFMDINESTKDNAYAWSGERIIVFDLPLNTEMIRLNYKLLEDLKNGVIFSSKYESRNKIYPKPHILVLANEPPFNEALSAYKWDITEIKEEKKDNFVPCGKKEIEVVQT